MDILKLFFPAIKIFLPLLIAMVILFVIIYLIKGKQGQEGKTPESEDYKHFVKRKYLMTEAEHNFYKVLQETVKDKYNIIPQVQLSKIIDVNKYEKNKRKYFNMIDRKSVDFALFDKQYFTPQIVIELDDTSHMLPKAEKNDTFKNEVLERTGIKLIRIKTAYSCNINELLSLLKI